MVGTLPSSPLQRSTRTNFFAFPDAEKIAGFYAPTIATFPAVKRVNQIFLP